MGTVVTSTLVADGTTPRYAIGSVNLAELLVAIAASATFVAILWLIHWEVVIGLILGGVF